MTQRETAIEELAFAMAEDLEPIIADVDSREAYAFAMQYCSKSSAFNGYVDRLAMRSFKMLCTEALTQAKELVANDWIIERNTVGKEDHGVEFRIYQGVKGFYGALYKDDECLMKFPFRDSIRFAKDAAASGACSALAHYILDDKVPF